MLRQQHHQVRMCLTAKKWIWTISHCTKHQHLNHGIFPPLRQHRNLHFSNLPSPARPPNPLWSSTLPPNGIQAAAGKRAPWRRKKRCAIAPRSTVRSGDDFTPFPPSASSTRLLSSSSAPLLPQATSFTPFPQAIYPSHPSSASPHYATLISRLTRKPSRVQASAQRPGEKSESRSESRP